MRQFYLVNEVGMTYFLDYRTSTLVSEIEDIGFEKENTYLTYENSFKKVGEKIPQASIQFTLVFLLGYKGYSDFLEFLRKSREQLRLFYKVDDSTKFMNVAFKSITKTQLESGAITSVLVLEKMSLWLKRFNYSIRVNSSDRGKIFPFSYPFEYTSSFNGAITIENNGDYKAPLCITIMGAVSNPEVEVIKDNEVISKMRLMVSSVNCTIEVNAELTDQYMTMTEGNTVTNIYQNQDFSCDNFLFVDRGTYQIRFKPGVNSETTCKIAILEGYGGH